MQGVLKALYVFKVVCFLLFYCIIIAMSATSLDLINDLIAQKEFESAKVALEELLKTDEKNIEALKLLGLCNVNLGNFEAGKNNFETVVKYKQDDASSWFYLASCYENLEDFLHAKTAYLEVINLRESYIDAYKNLCIVYLKTKEEEKAIELAEKVLQFVQDDYSIYYLIGTAYLSMKKFAESILYLEKALELNPTHSQLHNNLGTAYLTTNKYDKAYENYLKASELDPKNSLTFYNIASILQIQNKHKEACEFFQKAYDVEPNESYIVSLALSEFKSEQYNSAISHYKMLVAQHPEKQNFQYNLACCYEMIGEYNFAIGILDQLVLLNPKSLTMSQKLANLYLKTDQPAKAKEIYQRVISKGVVSDEIYYEYALVCVRAGDVDTAETILKKVVELNPNFANAHKDLGVIYLSKRLFDYAKDEFEKAITIAPDDIGIAFEYANFLHAISEYAKAQEFYKRTTDKLPNNPNALTFSALNLMALNRLEDALIQIEQALKDFPEEDFILFCAGKIHYLMKNYEKAQLFLIKSYEKNPTTEVTNLLGLNYFELENYDTANNIFLKLLEKNPTNTNLLLNSAKCYEKLSKREEAKEQLNKVLEMFPEFEEARELMDKLEK